MSFGFRLRLSALLLTTLLSSVAMGYRLGDRWSATAMSGSGLQQGDATLLTWSFIPDGTEMSGGHTSSLISFLDGLYGGGDGGTDLTTRPWFELFDASFERWSQVAGLDYMYEPNDDGLPQGNSVVPGFVGVRGDVRIGGRVIDGPSSVLAFNFFPSGGGDMTFDVADGGFYGNPQNNFVAMRNVIMHEHGHGIGISHVESDDADFLMEPFANLSFDGPQLDDILSAQRGYGDIFEKGTGNDSVTVAAPLGLVEDGVSLERGIDARTTTVAADAMDFMSIDGIDDVDYYSFTIDNPAFIDVTLTPSGPTYLEAPQFGDQVDYVTSEFNNLSVQLFDRDGVTQLGVDNSGGLGQPDIISEVMVESAGEYFLRIQGEIDEIQLYELKIDVTEIAPVIDVDFDDNGIIDCADVDALVAAIAGGGTDMEFDLTGDGSVDTSDLRQWLEDAGMANGLGGAYLDGDANLDGGVDVADFNVWNSNRFENNPAWCSGDFNADGGIDVADFNLWNSRRFQSSGPNTVPEPAFGCGILLGALACLRRRRS